MDSYTQINSYGKHFYVGALLGFTYLRRQKSFLQLVYHGEKYSQLKLINIQNNYENFIVNSWYLYFSLLIEISTINSKKKSFRFFQILAKFSWIQ